LRLFSITQALLSVRSACSSFSYSLTPPLYFPPPFLFRTLPSCFLHHLLHFDIHFHFHFHCLLKFVVFLFFLDILTIFLPYFVLLFLIPFSLLPSSSSSVLHTYTFFQQLNLIFSIPSVPSSSSLFIQKP